MKDPSSDSAKLGGGSVGAPDPGHGSASAKPKDPAAKPADPAAKAPDPAAKPADPAAKPPDPAASGGPAPAKPADPAAKPADPPAKPTGPAAKPTGPAQAPASAAPANGAAPNAPADPAPVASPPAEQPAAPQPAFTGPQGDLGAPKQPAPAGPPSPAGDLSASGRRLAAAPPQAPPPTGKYPAHQIPATHHGASSIQQRLKKLEQHLMRENPVLVGVVESFRQLDRVACRMGLLARDQSFATKIPWWPLVSVLGTFSAGKSSFINHYLKYDLQRAGNQAVDDKFTVICFSRENQSRVLPGLALDTDPRFPFYGMSDEIDKVADGEGRRIDAYLQLKTCPSEQLRGKIIIDSPGFDADAQRTSTLRISNHMIDLSDLVLVFFDARHPEPGAMRDTLEHLVRRSLKRHDATKFLYILNQIDITAREDNPEDVVAAWQRALAEFGLTAGRFFCIYNPDVEAHFHDSATQKRFEDKRDADLAEIKQRIYQVEVERSYRLVGVLEKNASFIESTLVPTLETALRRWRKLVLIVDGFAVGIPFLAMLVLSIVWGWWHGLRFAPPWWDAVAGNPVLRFGLIAALLGALGFVHFKVRAIIADRVKRDLARGSWRDHTLANLAGAFVRSTRWWRSIFLKRPAGWTQGARRRLTQVTDSAHVYVQSLNDHFTNPTG